MLRAQRRCKRHSCIASFLCTLSWARCRACALVSMCARCTGQAAAVLQEGVAGPWGAEGFKALVVKCTFAPLVVAATVFAQTFTHLWHACSGAPAQCKPVWECAFGMLFGRALGDDQARSAAAQHAAGVVSDMALTRSTAQGAAESCRAGVPGRLRCKTTRLVLRMKATSGRGQWQANVT